MMLVLTEGYQNCSKNQRQNAEKLLVMSNPMSVSPCVLLSAVIPALLGSQEQIEM